MKTPTKSREEAARLAREMYKRMDDISDHAAAVMYFEQVAASAGVSYQSWLLDNEGSPEAEAGFRSFAEGMSGLLW